MSKEMNTLTTKRFVIRKSLIGKNTIITFENKKKEMITYNHDEVYEKNKERFESMNCFKKYKSYTSSNNIPTFCRQSVRYMILSDRVQHDVQHSGAPPYTMQIRESIDNIYETNITNMENIKIYLLKLLLNNVFKYNESECRDKWMETTIDDIKFLIEE